MRRCSGRNATRSSSIPTIRGRPAYPGLPALCRTGRKRCWSYRARRTPYLVVALSFRVKSWIERVSRIGEVLHTPRIGLKAAQQIAAARPDAVVGIVDFDGLPAGIADDLREGGPGLTLRDASALFATLRAKADPAEIALAMKAASIANCALSAVPRDASLNTMIAAVEGAARNLGAEEVYVAAAPDLDRDCRFRRIEGEPDAGQKLRVTRNRRL